MVMKEYDWIKAIYRIKFTRKQPWYTTEGEWWATSTYCNENFGNGNWEYINEYFIFKHEEDMLLFKLRWGSR